MTYRRFSTVFPWAAAYNAVMKRHLGVALFFAFAGCGAPPTVGERTQPIINGSTDPGDNAVVLVAAQVPGSMNASLCTGEIVSPHVVLTAAHCVDPSATAPSSSSSSARRCR